MVINNRERDEGEDNSAPALELDGLKSVDIYIYIYNCKMQYDSR